ncbi:MAG: hypothetical protein ACI9NT_001181, partial [Bacteroidia bacterium]
HRSICSAKIDTTTDWHAPWAKKETVEAVAFFQLDQ